MGDIEIVLVVLLIILGIALLKLAKTIGVGFWSVSAFTLISAFVLEGGNLGVAFILTIHTLTALEVASYILILCIGLMACNPSPNG